METQASAPPTTAARVDEKNSQVFHSLVHPPTDSIQNAWSDHSAGMELPEGNQVVTTAEASTTQTCIDASQASLSRDVASLGHPGGSGPDDGTLLPPGLCGPPSSTHPWDLAAHEDPVQKIANGLRLLMTPGQVVELRALDVVTDSYPRPHVVSGFYDVEHLRI
jgi:hypothetical protein